MRTMRDDVGALIGSADWSPCVRGAPPSVQIDLFLELKVGRFGLFGVSPAFRPGLASTCFPYLVLRVPLASSRGCISTKCAAPWVETVSGPCPLLCGRRHLALRPACSETPPPAGRGWRRSWGRFGGGLSTVGPLEDRVLWSRNPVDPDGAGGQTGPPGWVAPAPESEGHQQP